MGGSESLAPPETGVGHTLQLHFLKIQTHIAYVGSSCYGCQAPERNP